MAELNNHSGRAHALLSASSSSRWLKCTPSAVAAEMYPNQDTIFTREGTQAHEVAEHIARGGSVEALEDWYSPPVPPEMVRCAESYRDYIQELIRDDSAMVLLEQRLDFSRWVPDGFGTGDCIIIQRDTLDVVDYKYGQGVAVSAIGNSQMRLYGLGALYDFGFVYKVRKVRLHIFQPRIGNISVEEISKADLLAWGDSIQGAARLAAEGKGEYCAGEHCRFCPHAGSCVELAAHCLDVHHDFGGIDAVSSLSPSSVAEILTKEPMISAWLKAVKDRALGALLDGESIPGFKVVEGRGSRAWSDEGLVAATLSSVYSQDAYTKTELLSPAALEKAIGKAKVAELVSSLIVSKPGSPAVAPESDKRKPFDRLAEARKDFE